MPAGNNTQAVTSALRVGGMPFSFEILEPGLLTGEIVSFPAYIDSISDNFSPEWGEYNDMGRADPKIMYRSFNRSLSINFKIVALQREGTDSPYDLIAIRLNTLAKAVHPHYVSGKGYVGRYIKFNIGKLYVNEFGAMVNLGVSIDNSSPWQVNIEGKGERPVVMSVDMGIRWIGDKRPDAGKSISYYDKQLPAVNIQTL